MGSAIHITDEQPPQIEFELVPQRSPYGHHIITIPVPSSLALKMIRFRPMERALNADQRLAGTGVINIDPIPALDLISLAKRRGIEKGLGNVVAIPAVDGAPVHALAQQ
jgi:hypothetical protein